MDKSSILRVWPKHEPMLTLAGADIASDLGSHQNKDQFKGGL
jgi:hypothetical protein